MIGLALATEEGQYFIPFEVLKSEEAEPVRAWLADGGIPKRGYDLHRIDLALHWQGIAFAGAAFDVHLAAYLLDPTESNQSLSGLASKYGLAYLQADEDVFGKGQSTKFPIWRSSASTWPENAWLYRTGSRSGEGVGCQ